jgi:predicted DNA binding CopG/RHH family protein
MTREDIIRMAREANRYASNQTGDSFEWQEIRDERFAALVAAAERAGMAADLFETYASIEGIAQRCAEQIRARSKT